MDQNRDEAFSDPAFRKNTKRVRIWYAQKNSSQTDDATVHSPTANKVQGLIDHAYEVNTHPHTWAIVEKKNIEIAKNYMQILLRSTRTEPQQPTGIATVMHSYPSNAGKEKGGVLMETG